MAGLKLNIFGDNWGVDVTDQNSVDPRILVMIAARIILSLVTDMLMQRRDMFVVVIKVLFVATLVPCLYCPYQRVLP